MKLECGIIVNPGRVCGGSIGAETDISTVSPNDNGIATPLFGDASESSGPGRQAPHYSSLGFSLKAHLGQISIQPRPPDLLVSFLVMSGTEPHDFEWLGIVIMMRVDEFGGAASLTGIYIKYARSDSVLDLLVGQIFAAILLTPFPVFVAVQRWIILTPFPASLGAIQGNAQCHILPKRALAVSFSYPRPARGREKETADRPTLRTRVCEAEREKLTTREPADWGRHHPPAIRAPSEPQFRFDRPGCSDGNVDAAMGVGRFERRHARPGALIG